MKDIRKKNDSELAAFIAEKREELRTLRFNASGAALRDVKAARNMKKEVARALTERRAREIAPGTTNAA
jgi:ribosomal protein L29